MPIAWSNSLLASSKESFQNSTYILKSRLCHRSSKTASTTSWVPKQLQQLTFQAVVETRFKHLKFYLFISMLPQHGSNLAGIPSLEPRSQSAAKCLTFASDIVASLLTATAVDFHERDWERLGYSWQFDVCIYVYVYLLKKTKIWYVVWFTIIYMHKRTRHIRVKAHVCS